MSYGRMVKAEAELSAEVEAWLAHAEAADATEDGEFGTEAIGLDLGAVESDMAELDQARPAAQGEHLGEQPRQRPQVTLAEVADGAEVRFLQACHRHEVEALLAGSSNPARGIDPPAVGVQKKRRHHRRVIGRLAPLLGVVRQDRRQVQALAHRLADEVRRMPGRHEVVERRRQQPSLVHVPRTKGFAHAA